MHTGIWWVNLLERDHFEDLAIGRRVLLKSIEKSDIGFVYSTTGTTLGFVNKVIFLRVAYNGRTSCLAGEILCSQEGPQVVGWFVGSFVRSFVNCR